jgi:hypothetical protein
MTPGDHRKDCCKLEAGNLCPTEKYNGRADLVFRRCSVCGCRHFEATLDPGRFNTRGREIGPQVN